MSSSTADGVSSVPVLDAHLSRRHLLQRAAITAAVASASPLIAACGGDDGSDSTSASSIRLGLTPYQDNYSVLVGLEKGIFAKAGLTPKIVDISYESLTEVLASGSVDATAGNDAAVLAASEKLPMVLANDWYLFMGGSIVVRKDAGFTTYADLLDEGLAPEQAIRQACAQLDGKTILTSVNTDLEYTVVVAAEQGGLTYGEDVEVHDGPIDENLAAFLRGDGDGYVGGLPERQRAIDEGGIVLVTNRDLGPKATAHDGFITTWDAVNEDPERWVKLQRAMYQTLTYIQKNRSESFNIIIDALARDSGVRFEQEDLTEIWNRLELFPASGEESERLILTKDSEFYWRPRFDFLEKVFRQRGVLKKPVNLDAVFAFSWIQAEYMEKYESTAWKGMGSRHPSGDPVKPPASYTG